LKEFLKKEENKKEEIQDLTIDLILASHRSLQEKLSESDEKIGQLRLEVQDLRAKLDEYL